MTFTTVGGMTRLDNSAVSDKHTVEKLLICVELY